MDEKGGICDKIEKYLSELGKWPVWRALLLGQFLSTLLCLMALLSHYINKEVALILPTGQSFLHYMMLCITFTTWLACRSNEKGLISIIKARGWRYLLLGLIDVQANTLIASSHQFTTLTSIQLLDCVAIPVALALSCLILGVRYRIVHIAGVSVCLMGVGCLVWADIDGGKPVGKNQLVGDMLCLSGAVLFAVVAVLQELSVKTTDIIEYLGMLGLYGSIICGAQMIILEKQSIQSIQWENESIIYFLSFGIAQFLFYSLTPFMLRDTGATCLQLSLLTSDFYSLIVGILLLQYKFHALYFLSFTLVMCGIYIYAIKKTPISAEQHLNNAAIIEQTRSHGPPREYVTPVMSEGNFELSALGILSAGSTCPPEGLTLSMSTDTAFSSFYGSQVFQNTKGNRNNSAA